DAPDPPRRVRLPPQGQQAEAQIRPRGIARANRDTMIYPDFHARAELYLGSDWHTAAAQGARSFATAAHAIRFALEEAAPVSLRGAKLLVGDTIFERDDLAMLYRSPAFPLQRKSDIKRSRARRARNRRAAQSATPLRSGRDHRVATA